MNNIVIFKKYDGKKKGDAMIEELLSELIRKNKTGHEYSLGEMRDIANNILKDVHNYSGRCATPIVRIAKSFDFKTYRENLKESGDININGDTKRKYVHDKVILVNKDEELFHQRFVVAHELAHYLFDFLGNPDYENTDVLFAESYIKDQQPKTSREKRANTFAAEIMMPNDLFIRQYNIAKCEESNHMFIIMYLSRYFETSIDSIEKRIGEVLR